MENKTVKAIVNANVVLENGIIWDGVILIAGERILRAGKAAEVEIPEGAQIIDAKDAYVGPGFVDLHVHGGVGKNTMKDPKEAAEHFLKHGETTILATCSTKWEYEELMDAIRIVKEGMKTVKTIKGIYMEGPYMNPNYGAAKGMITWNKEIREEEFKPLVDSLGKDVKVFAMAPEREETLLPFLKYAREVNPDVVFSVGHSEATPEQVRALGSKYRPKLMTHIMNATGRSMKDSGGLRSCGPDEYCMSDPEMYAELISDSLGVHVRTEMQRLVLRNKGIERVVLITDSTATNNPPPEQYKHVKDVSFNALGRISGSKLTMDMACRNIMSHTNCGIAQAFKMASTNPARVIGMDQEIGSIEPGKLADLVFVDDRFNVKMVMQEGQICQF